MLKKEKKETNFLKIYVIVFCSILLILVIGLISYIILSTYKEEMKFSSYSQKEALNFIKKSKKTEDFVCSKPEYLDEKKLEHKGVNYVYCYLKYDEETFKNIKISYELIDSMIDPNFNVTVEELKSILDENKTYSYGSLSAKMGNILFENNYKQDIVEIKLKIEHPFENEIKFTYEYAEDLSSLIKLKKGTYYGDYYYTISEMWGIYHIYKYDKVKKQYTFISDYLCNSITRSNSYYSEYGKYEDVESCLIESNINEGYLIFNDNKYVLLDMNTGKTNIFNTLYLIGDSKYFVAEKNDEYGIVTSDGNVIVDYKYELIGDLPKISYNDFSYIEVIPKIKYSIKNDMIVFKENDKYGILRISNGDVLVPADKDYIELIINYSEENGKEDIKYYKVNKNNKWYIYDLNNQIVYQDNNVNEIHLVNSDMLITREKENIILKDLHGNILTDKKLKVNSYQGEDAYNFGCDAIDYMLYDEKITIHIVPYGWCSCYGECIYEGTSDVYVYDINTKVLEKE